jgi:uncharacterized membrane protein
MTFKERSARLTDKWMVVGIVATMTVGILVDYYDDSGRGVFAETSLYVMYTAVIFFWDLRQQLWFWLAITIVGVLHGMLFFEVPWQQMKLPSPLLPLLYCAALLDFGVIYLCMTALERIEKK